MPIEYINDRLEQLDREPVDMTIGNVQLQGIYEVEESGSGFTEEYKAERKRESGGAVAKDEVEEPPAAELRVVAWGTADDWSSLNELRKQRDPFAVSIGPFSFSQMGIANLEGTEVAEYPEAREFTITLQEFRRVVVQRRSIEDATGGGSGDDGSDDSSSPGDPAGPSGWAPDEGPDVQTDTVASGATETYTVGAGETWGRRVIDQSASGANAHVSTQGGGWAIQDVGLNGTFNGRALSEGDVFIHARTPNGNGATIQHLYMGDGSSRERDTGIFFNPSSSGDLTAREINAQGWRDNAMYFSAPHESGSGGPNILIEDSYVRNNETSGYRLGRGTIRNCVGHMTPEITRGPRVVWARPPGTVEIEDCDLLAEAGNQYAIWAGTDNGSSTVNLRNSRVGGNVEEENSSSVNGSTGGQPDVNSYASGIPGGPRQAADGVGHEQGSGSPGGGTV